MLETSDGEYRCRVCVFAIGVTEPWSPPIPGLEAAPHYARHAPERYQGKSVFIVGKRNSGFELAQGLLPWARRIVLASPRPVDTAMLAFSPLSIRYLSPYTEHVRGGTGSYVVDAAIERVERHADGYRIHASGTTWEGELELESDEVIAATGFRAPVRDLPSVGVAMVNDGRMPAQTPYWESISVPGIYFAGNVTQASPGLRKHGATSSSGSVNGFRYNARILAQHIAEKHFGIRRERRPLDRDEVVPFPRGELAHAPELWTQKGISRGWSASTRRRVSRRRHRAARGLRRSRGQRRVCGRGRVRRRRDDHPGRVPPARRASGGAPLASASAAYVRHQRLPGGAARARLDPLLA